MRIRKRNAPFVEPAQQTRFPVSAVKSGEDDEHFVGQQDNCTCCARLRKLENRELRNEFGRECHERSNRFANGISLADENQIRICGSVCAYETEGFGDLQGILHQKIFTTRRSLMQKESNVATTMELLGDLERVRTKDHNIEANGTREDGDGQCHRVEGDVNHPGNKPKESLLYSLYCVFSQLSGKVVLTAREALSRIIEERLPGLDEETGLPSVQVAKVMRSNPYFVHIEGGKFFLCSGPFPLVSKEDLDSAEDFVDNEQPSRSTGPRFQSKKCPRNSLSKVESSKESQQQPQQPSGSSEVMRTKRPRSKEVATIDVDVAVRKAKCTSSGSKRDGHQRALKPQNSVSEQGKHGVDPVLPICKRYDGRGWKCYEIALPGYSMCRHHHELIVNRLARLRSSGRLGSKKAGKRRKNSAKPSKEEHPVVINEGEISANNEQHEPNWWKNVKARSLKSINN